MQEININNINSVLDHTRDCAVTVFGDFCLDKYIYVDPEREEVSVETGLPAYQVVRKAMFPGVGGTVTNNLRSLGVRVNCVGLIGDDGEGYDLQKSLEAIGASTALMVRSEKIQTNVYQKPMRLSPDGIHKEMNRFDFRNFTATPEELEDRLLMNLEASLNNTRGVVICDQYLQRNYAAVTDNVRDALARLACLYKNKVFYADSRGFTGSYRDVIIKCNQSELADAVKTQDGLFAQAKALLAINGRAVVITAGAEGAYVFEGGDMAHIPAFHVGGPIDITGAGDATNAGVITGLASGLSLREAVLLGSCISSITIQQLGVTGTATVEQVKERLSIYKAG